MKVRSLVGLIPLLAVETLEPDVVDRLPGFKRRLEWFVRWISPGAGSAGSCRS